MSLYYVLNGREPEPVDDIQEWAKRFEYDERHIGHDEVGDWIISTVFLGLDHNLGHGPPLLFETMVFGPDDWSGESCERCSTYDEAEAQHARMVERIKAAVAMTNEVMDEEEE